MAVLLGAAGTNDPSALLARIHQQGARTVVAALDHGDEAAWNDVLAKIEAGTVPWLQVGLALRPGTDAGTAESLSVAMATALLSNPSGALRLIVPVFGEDRICSVPLIEPTPAQAALYVARAKAALARVEAPSLRPLASRCAARIGQP